MSKRNTKSRAARRFASEKSRIRASNASIDTMLSLATNHSLDSLTELWSWSIKRFRLHSNLRSISPRAPAQLSTSTSIPGYTKIAYLKTISAHLISKSALIEKYIKSNCCKADGEELHRSAFVNLQKFSVENIWSYSAISTMLFAKSKADGLDAQRAWMQRELYTTRPTFSNLIFYGKGIVFEGDRHPAEVNETLQRQIFSYFEGSPMLPIMWYLIIRPDVDYEGCDSLLPYIATHATVDQYEFITSLVVSGWWPRDVGLAEIYDKIILLMKKVGDWRGEAVCHMGRSKPSHDRAKTVAHLLARAPDLKDGASLRNREIFFANKFYFEPNSPRSYFMESVYGLRASSSLAEVAAYLYKRDLALSALSDMGLVHGYEATEPLEAEKSKSTDGVSSLNFQKLEDFKVTCLEAIERRDFSAALTQFYDVWDDDKLALAYFPSDALLVHLTEDDVFEIAASPEIAVSIVRLAEKHGSDLHELAFVAIERYMSEKGISTPSQLVDLSDKDVSFLQEACIPACLRKSLEFLSRSEMENERLTILMKLIDIGGEKISEYATELHAIVEQQTIGEILHKFHVGKIQCDEVALAQWAKLEIGPRFDRLRDFIEVGLLPVERNSDVHFLTHVAAGNKDPFMFKVPSNESLDIARAIISDMVNKYSMDPRYGIDSYISLGMRHGAIAAHFRSPLSAEHLITSKGLDGYAPSEYWKSYYEQEGRPWIGDIVSSALARFSEEYDGLLDEFKNELMQVRRNEKPRGLVVADWSEASVLSFSARFAKVKNFDFFLEEFVAFFLSNIELNLDSARDAILNSISAQIFTALDRLETEVREASGYNRLPPFSDAVARARQELTTAIREVALWHRVARSTDIEPLGVVEIIRAAERISMRLYPDFKPKVEFWGDISYMMHSSLHALIEVFRALFTNIYEHSGVIEPKVRVTIDSSNLDALRITFASDCENLGKAAKAAADVNERVSSGEYEKKLPKEGGSGLAKVARATISNGSPNIDVQVDQISRTFVVDMAFAIINVRGNA